MFFLHPNSLKTHCPRQHPYNEANTYRNTAGKRECRRCHAIRQRANEARGYAEMMRLEPI